MKTKMEERMETMAANEKERTLEETFALLDEKIAQLENSEISLEDSFRVYKEGMEQFEDRHCGEKNAPDKSGWNDYRVWNLRKNGREKRSRQMR